MLLNFAFSDFADVVSVLGFVLTIYVSLTIWTIKKQFLSRIRLPKLHEQLRESASELSALNEDYLNVKREVRILISKIEVILDSIRKKVGGQTRRRVKECLQVTNKYNGALETEDMSWTIYTDVQQTIQEIDNYQEDQKWER